MTAAEIYAEVRDWPEGAKAPFDYFQGTQAWYDADENLVHEYVAELAFIGAAIKWLLEHGVFITAYKSAGRYVLTASGGDRAIDIGRFDAPTLIEALACAVIAERKP